MFGFVFVGCEQLKAWQHGLTPEPAAINLCMLGRSILRADGRRACNEC
jgi:hypothetical protein